LAIPWDLGGKTSVMQIFVKTLTGKAVAINIEASQTVETAKKHFWEREGKPLSKSKIGQVIAAV
jgi:hypothetical protein